MVEYMGKEAKTVCQVVAPVPRRDFLRGRLGDPQGKEAKTLSRSCDHFAEWRWKTLFNVTKDLERMQKALQVATAALNAKDMGSRDAQQGQAFLDAVKCDTFWARCHAIHRVAKVVERFSSWLQGCPCHEEECKAKGTFHCDMKGCKAPLLSARCRAFLGDLEEARRNLEGQALEVDIHACLTRMLAFASVKLAWVDELPYFVWQVDSPAMADAFLTKYDAATDAPHRVSERFGGDEFRGHMEAWRATGEVSYTLALELQSYRACMLDDTWSESQHRDVSGERRRVTYATQAWESSTSRLPQNVSMWESLSEAQKTRFDLVWRRWKAIAQPVPRQAWNLVPKRCTDRVATSRVYRCGLEGLTDWHSYLSPVLRLACGESNAGPALRVAGRMKVDFLTRTLKTGDVYSVPILSGEGTLALLDRVPLEEADVSMHAASSGMQFFVVVDTDIRRKRIPLTETARDRRNMWVPCSVQLYKSVAGDDGTFQLEADGQPRVIDLVDLTSWQVWRGALRAWTRTSTLTQGALGVRGFEAISTRPWDFAKKGVPVVVVLEHLAQHGWRRGQPPDAHAIDTPKVFQAKCPLGHRAYLQCLAALGTLMQRGLQTLASRKPMQYYQLLLASDRPGDVPVLDTASAYRALEAHQPAMDMIADGTASAMEQDADFSDVPMIVPLTSAVDGEAPELPRGTNASPAPRREEGRATWAYLPDKRAPPAGSAEPKDGRPRKKNTHTGWPRTCRPSVTWLVGLTERDMCLARWRDARYV